MFLFIFFLAYKHTWYSGVNCFFFLQNSRTQNLFHRNYLKKYFRACFQKQDCAYAMKIHVVHILDLFPQSYRRFSYLLYNCTFDKIAEMRVSHLKQERNNHAYSTY